MKDYKLRNSLMAYIMFCSILAFSQPNSSLSDPLVHNVYNRPSVSLNGNWKYLVDRYETSVFNFFRVPFDSIKPEHYGRDPVWLDETPKDKTDRLEYDWDTADELTVPGDWNSQEESLYFYEGSIWYRRKFNDPRTSSDQRLLLYFGAANYLTEVFINGKKIGSHIGGFTPFNFFIDSDIRAKDNSLVIRVDNKRDVSGVPTDVTDWWNYGGLTRDVKLLALPKTYIGDYSIALESVTSRKIKGYVQLYGINSANQDISLRCSELSVDIELKTNENGRATFNHQIDYKDISFWEPTNPKLYEFTLSTSEDKLKDKVGLRTIQTQGKNILLNDKPIYLRGICAHEENPIKGGRANSLGDARLLLGWAKDLNANFMRLAHYPHNEYMPRLADEMGVLLWEEIPVYWTIDWKNEETYQLAEQQLSEVMFRDKNRASVIIWSLANETPQIPEKVNFLTKLARFARDYDKSRLISAALFKSRNPDGTSTVNDGFSEYTDIISFNEYLGWYEGTPEIIGNKEFVFSQDKPVFVSEWGAGALSGFRGDRLTRWSEDYQDYLYEEQLELMDRIPGLVGFSPWILADFRSPRRMHPEYQEGWNRKGVIGQNGERKLAFYRLKEYYKAKKKSGQ